MEKAWAKQSNNFSLVETSHQYKKLPKGIYRVGVDPRTGFYLSHNNEKFDFSYKVYGVEKKFIDRVTKTYKNTTNNLGVLLNGMKGTGKTVTAELICNNLELPVFIITEPYEGLSEFINDIQQDIICFFDEYEKMYRDENYSVLTIMDGVLNNGFRRVFLLTTNSLYVNDNLLQRPGRIRYLKSFKDLSLEHIIEIIDDKLIHPEFKDELIKYISELKMITVDIVKAIVEEVNIHHEGPKEFKNIINATPSDESWDVFIVNEEGKHRIKHKGVKISPIGFNENHVHDNFYINGQRIGSIEVVEDEENIRVKPYANFEGDKLIHYSISQVSTTHRNFREHVF